MQWGKNLRYLYEYGKSVKINELINKMINLSGFTVRDEKNPDGDIEIKIIGLRPGENYTKNY